MSEEKVTINDFSILQPLELLQGESISQNLIEDPNEMKKRLLVAKE